MKYAVFFLLAGVLFAACAVVHQGPFWWMLWPAVSFGLVAIGYVGAGPAVFGKRPDGSVSPLSTLLLLPFLIYLRGVWHVLRVLQREAPYDELLPGVLIGRRLLAWECPPEVTAVLDLTCEFAEPGSIRRKPGYVCFPILDGAVPEARPLVDVLRRVNSMEGRLLIHCAQGHGRTGLAAAVLLLMDGHATTLKDALTRVRAVRPGVGLGKNQRHVLREAAEIVREHDGFHTTT